MIQKKLRFVLVFAALVAALLLFTSKTGTITAQESALPPLKVIQLGDSYSAGNGARNDGGDRNYVGVSGCFRSPTNWGSQFVESLGDVFSVTYVNRACSGGVVDDILNARDMEDGEFKRIDGSCPEVDYPDEEFYVDNSTLRCSRFLQPQINAVDSSVDLVLMTGGGNDIRFATIVERCFVRGRRDIEDCRNAVNNANVELANVENRLIDTFAELRSRLGPNGRVAFVTYPYLVPDIGYQVQRRNFRGQVVETYNAGQEIRALGLEGDRRQQAAVAAANAAAGEDFIVIYDGTKDLFEEHLPNPPGFDANEDRWIFEAYDTRQPIEWYHYNPLGHQNLGNAISVFETFGAVGGSFDTNANIDIIFVVDTTGSMGDEIAQVRADLSDLVDQLASTTDSYRVGVVSYRDFQERTGSSTDYPSRVDQNFTSDLAAIQAAIDSLDASGGGDFAESVFSGVQTAIEFPWRPGVTKIAIVIGDAPALSPEPISGLTSAQIVANSIAVDPVQVIGVNVGSLDSNGALSEIASGTGGSIIAGTGGLTNAISEIIGSAVVQPLAWIGTAYSGKIGIPITFDASGSYDPSGGPISLYEWDFDGDGEFDLETTDPIATHTYDAAFNSFVIMRVTSSGGSALASARTVVNEDGFVSQGDEEFCEVDENGYSIILDDDGQFIRCLPDNLPEEDIEGVFVVLDDGTPNECSVSVGDLGRGIAAQDNAIGKGYIMYSEALVQSRLGLISSNAEHFVAVRYDERNGWRYDANNKYLPFVIESTDVIVAEVDFSSDMVRMLVGEDFEIGGVKAGYKSGDLSIIANMWNGSTNAGEFGVSGTQFEKNECATGTIGCDLSSLGGLGRGIPAFDRAVGTGYLMYSEEPVAKRFDVSLRSGADNLVIVRQTSTGWEYDQNSGYASFEPRVGDILLAELDFSADTVNLLVGIDMVIDGITAGYDSSDINVAPNQWNGSPNMGEYEVDGTYFERDCG